MDPGIRAQGHFSHWSLGQRTLSHQWFGRSSFVWNDNVKGGGLRIFATSFLEKWWFSIKNLGKALLSIKKSQVHAPVNFKPSFIAFFESFCYFPDFWDFLWAFNKMCRIFFPSWYPWTYLMPTKPFSLIPLRSIGTPSHSFRTEMHTLQACWPPLNENYWFLYKKVYLLIPFLSYAILCPPSSYTWQMKKGLDLVKCFIRRHRCYFPSPLLSIPLSLCSVFQHQPNPPSRAQ